MRRLVLAAAAVSACLAGPALAQQHDVELPAQPPALPPGPLPFEEDSQWVIYPIRNGVFMISGPSGNAGVQVGTDGVLLVDTGRAEDAEALLAQVRRLSDLPIRYILLTGGDADNTGANATLGVMEEDLVSANERPDIVQGFGSVPILSHEQVMFRMLEDGVDEGLPTQTYFVEQKDIYFNNEPVSLIHAPGHTPGSSLIMFRRSDVIAAGDIYSPDRYPDIAVERGGSISDYLVSLNRLIRLTVPEFNQQGGTFVIPGHGRLSDEGDIGEYRDMVTFIHDRVEAMISRGLSLEEIKRARPTFDYDPLFGAAAGDRFVEQVYLSLTREGE